MRVLITGSAVRIGKSIAEYFAGNNWQVVIHYNKSAQAAADLLEKLPGNGHRMIQADLSETQEIENIWERLKELDALPDCLINNASVYRRSPLAELSANEVAEDMFINFQAPFMLMQGFKNNVGRGSIINILDQRINRVEPGAGTYGIAKKALRDATEAAALEWCPEIRVNGVAPGMVLPPPGVDAAKMIPLIEKNVPMGKESSPNEIAGTCLFLAEAETICGQIIYVDGGMHLTSPQLNEVTRAHYKG